MIGNVLGRGSLARRIVTRGVVVVGAVWVGGLITRSFPHDQLLVFPVGSAFPNATRFSASWKQSGDSEPRGGVTLAFTSPPPLQIRQHADLPNGDYLLSIEVEVDSGVAGSFQENGPNAQNAQNAPTAPNVGAAAIPRGVQTNIERRVTLLGGETIVALAAGGF